MSHVAHNNTVVDPANATHTHTHTYTHTHIHTHTNTHNACHVTHVNTSLEKLFHTYEQVIAAQW